MALEVAGSSPVSHPADCLVAMPKPSFSELINGEVPVLVDFYADWCQPCHILSPTVARVAKEYKGKVKVIKVDVDRHPKVAAKYGIRGIPTLILFRRGQPVWRQAGVVPEHVIRAALDRALAS